MGKELNNDNVISTTKVDPSKSTQVIEVRIPKETKQFGVTRHHASDLDSQSSKQTAVFVSYKKDYVIFMEHNEYIQFKHHNFTTNKPELINFLRNHPAFGVEIFEGEFPEHIKKRIEEDRKYITRDTEMFMGV